MLSGRMQIITVHENRYEIKYTNIWEQSAPRAQAETVTELPEACSAMSCKKTRPSGVKYQVFDVSHYNLFPKCDSRDNIPENGIQSVERNCEKKKK